MGQTHSKRGETFSLLSWSTHSQRCRFLNVQRERANPSDPGPGKPHCKTDAFMRGLLTDRPGNHRPVSPVSNVWSWGGQQTHVCHMSCWQGLKTQSSHILKHFKLCVFYIRLTTARRPDAPRQRQINTFKLFSFKFPFHFRKQTLQSRMTLQKKQKNKECQQCRLR